MRATVPSLKLLTHTDPAPTATPSGTTPTGVVCVWLDFGSMRVTVPAPLLVTHTEPSPTAIAAGAAPTGNVG